MYAQRAIFVSALAMLLARPLPAQMILMLGEMEVDIVNPVKSKEITANASGSVVGGTRRQWYPVTTAYNMRSDTTSTFSRQHLDRVNPPGEGDEFFAYGAYLITVDGLVAKAITLDYRDADFEDGVGQYGTGYVQNIDMKVYYNCADSCFYSDPDFSHRIVGSMAVWEGGRKSPAYPKIPVTITTTVPQGVVMVDGALCFIPHQVKWAVRDSLHLNTHSLEALSSQTADNLVYGFVSWSDGGARQHNVVASLDKFSSVFTANYAIVGPVRVTNFWVSGLAGEHPHLTWDVHPRDDVNYYVYRKVRHNGVLGQESLIATLPHSSSSYDDPDYTVAGYSSDLLFYDVRAHHVPTNTLAEPYFLGGLYGDIEIEAQPGNLEALLETDAPTDYSLTCHPNPFNPSTTIRHGLPERSHVTLTVFNSLGQKVAALQNSEVGAGYHEVRFDGSGMASGAYYVHLAVIGQLGIFQYSKVNKLLLMK